jgi:DNA-directed RNA polymerase specialized sigma24 family protein
MATGKKHDLCQESFMKAYRELSTLKDRNRFSAGFTALPTTPVTAAPERHRQTFVELEPGTRFTRSPVENQLAVEAALRHLPEEQREAVVLKVFTN